MTFMSLAAVIFISTQYQLISILSYTISIKIRIFLCRCEIHMSTIIGMHALEYKGNSCNSQNKFK